MTQTMQLDIVSAERSIYSGKVSAFFATGMLGELGIYPGHTPLLTTLKPGQLRFVHENASEELLYVSGGVLEVQPEVVTVLADTAIRAIDLDEETALLAKQRAEAILKEKKSELDYSHAMAELAQAIAQLHVLRKLREKGRS